MLVFMALRGIKQHESRSGYLAGDTAVPTQLIHATLATQHKHGLCSGIVQCALGVSDSAQGNRLQPLFGAYIANAVTHATGCHGSSCHCVPS